MNKNPVARRQGATTIAEAQSGSGWEHEGEEKGGGNVIMERNMTEKTERRDFLKLGAFGLAGGALLAGATAIPLAQKAAAQAAAGSKLHEVLDRGHLVVGTGSTNAPWHFEDEKGDLVGMDIAMARILAKGLFDDETKVEFVREDPAASSASKPFISASGRVSSATPSM